MFRPRLNTVFASRWKALWWAASVLFSAYWLIPREGEDPAQGLADVVGAQPSPTPSANPWAPDSAASTKP